MEKKKRQSFKEGSLVKIELAGNKVIYGRLLPGFRIGIYDLIIDCNGDMPSIENIIESNIIIYVVQKCY